MKKTQASTQLLEALAVTAELTGTQLSQGAARVLAEDLAIYPEQQVIKALVRCRRELKARLTIADVISRLDDGRPGPEEAWAMLPRSEDSSAFWTQEMREAFGVCSSLLDDDPVQARMAFLEAYRKKVTDARDAGAAIYWEFTPGRDKSGREQALIEGVEKGRISSEAALRLLPYHDEAHIPARLLQLAEAAIPSLPAPAEVDPSGIPQWVMDLSRQLQEIEAEEAS
jgi:hypothetical protein